MKRLFFLVIALAIFSCLISSCNKNPDNPTPPIFDSATIMGFKDSTQLVKSIATQFYDNNGNMDTLSPPAYLYYDTTNKKIYLTTQAVTDVPANNLAVVVFSYNNAGLIINLKFNDPDDESSVYFTYDGENVIKNITTQYSDGSSDAVNITKTNLPSGGYSLSEKSSYTDFVHDSTLSTQNFDANGRLISKSDVYLPVPNGGYKDSILYDAVGNISKVIQTNLSGAGSTYNLFEFSSRDTKGEQLSNFNAILFNGVANLPEVEANISFGDIFAGFDDYYFYQFTKYPSTATKVYQQSSDSYITFANNPQYDSKGRLIKYIMYNGDTDFNYAEEIDLTYYK